MDITKVHKHIDEFKTIFMPKDFQWRPSQRESIEQIIEAYFNPDIKTVICDMPTGSGKSIIALCVSYVLNKFNREGYILASDISLQDQYEKDLEKFKFNWGSVKGINNYQCIDNGETVKLGTCKISKKPAKSFHCYDECPYYSNRNKAKESPTSILNYNYWLTMMNEVNPNVIEEEQIIFPARNFLIADEAHKINEIIQNAVSPVLYKDDLLKIQTFLEFVKNQHLNDKVPNGIFSEIEIIFDNLFRPQELRPNETFSLLLNLIKKFEELKPVSLILQKEMKRYANQNIPKEWKKAFNINDWLTKLKIKIKEYLIIINKTRIDNLVRNYSLLNNEINQITFNCLAENFLMDKYFHQHTGGFLILMSATFSDPKEYIKGLNLKGAKYIKLKSQFDFSKSPIYYQTKYKINYKDTDKNLPWLARTVDEIVSKHPERGLIHSGSYSLALKVYEKLSNKTRKRIILYSGTTEKREGLEEFKLSKDKILLGPSLLEGLDLKNDLGRWQIFLKVPYLNLKDHYVSAKMKLDPKWYQWKTIIALLQGVGRIVRNDSDWGITYMLDATFINLLHYNRNYFPPEFLNRLKKLL